MFIRFSEKLRNEDKGFTLIELMVVVLIIAILIAIAIPTFLGARRRAQDRQAQSNLRNGLTAQKTFYTEPQEYTTDPTALGDIESNLAWGTADASARGIVVQYVDTVKQLVILRSFSKSGVMFCIADRAQLGSADQGVPASAGTYYAKVDAAGTTSTATCTSGWGVTTALGW